MQGTCKAFYGRLIQIPNGAVPLDKVQGIPQSDEYVVIKESVIISYAYNCQQRRPGGGHPAHGPRAAAHYRVLRVDRMIRFHL
jgi:hypothetical protein